MVLFMGVHTATPARFESLDGVLEHVTSCMGNKL
jgi:hypothetical protein